MNKATVPQLLSELKQVHRSDMATRSSDTDRVIDINGRFLVRLASSGVFR